ncbi:hypothetical protein MKW92_038238 [Papaver armeniacum]|nr:hypothetical protein MKW92_038238 [Papaver armeniacum]
MGDKAISRIRIIGLVGASRLEEIIHVATTNLLVSASAAITLSGSNKYLQHIGMLKGSPYISRGLDIMFVCKGYTTVYLGVRLSALFALGAGQEQDLNALLLIFLVTHEPPSHTVAWVREAAEIRIAFAARNDAGHAFNTSPRWGIHEFQRYLDAAGHLGISSLLSYVPVSLGTAHQAGALTRLSLTIFIDLECHLQSF